MSKDQCVCVQVRRCYKETNGYMTGTRVFSENVMSVIYNVHILIPAFNSCEIKMKYFK